MIIRAASPDADDLTEHEPNVHPALLPLSLALMLCVPVLSPAAPSCAAKSGATIPAVVELYTSEGCDSCPPADRWFSTLAADAARGTVVPLAFHVDYWDSLGWKDRFGDPRYSARQREVASRGGARVVYTPQIFVDGREYRSWRKPAADRIGATPGRASKTELRLSASPSATEVRIALTGAGTAARYGAAAYVALLESGLSSDVSAGENRGVQLHHDFVVRGWQGPFAFDAGKLDVATALALPADAVPRRTEVAVVAVDERGGVLQALALPLRECGG